MKYYLLKKGTEPETALELGETSFDVFYDYGGLKTLSDMANAGGQWDLLLDYFEIYTDSGEVLEIKVFLDLLSTLQVRLK